MKTSIKKRLVEFHAGNCNYSDHIGNILINAEKTVLLQKCRGNPLQSDNAFCRFLFRHFLQTNWRI